jgi:hypothetical protein
VLTAANGRLLISISIISTSLNFEIDTGKYFRSAITTGVFLQIWLLEFYWINFVLVDREWPVIESHLLS